MSMKTVSGAFYAYAEILNIFYICKKCFGRPIILLKRGDFMNKRKLSGDVSCDVLIIGGGMAGLLCAYEIGQSGGSCIVCEAECAGGGISGSTTGKVSAQHGLYYAELIDNTGVETARLCLESNLEAVAKFRGICKKEGLPWEDVSSYVYSRGGREALEVEKAALRRLGYDADIVGKTVLPFPVAGALEFKDQGQIAASDVMEGLAKTAKVYEHTPIEKITATGKAYTDGAAISAGSIIVATHFPFINRYGMYYLKMHQERSWFVAAEGCDDVEGIYIGAEDGISLRRMGDLLYIGGAAARTGSESEGWHTAELFAAENFPGSRIRYRWATQDCMTLDKMPYIGRYSPLAPKVFVATGFNKWGMTGSMLSAMILSDLVAGRQNRYEELYSPSRSIFRRGALTNLGVAVSGLVSLKTPRCPHMGCALEWNRYEHTWDCPCHGSRFEADGELINNPARHGFTEA